MMPPAKQARLDWGKHLKLIEKVKNDGAKYLYDKKQKGWKNKPLILNEYKRLINSDEELKAEYGSADVALNWFRKVKKEYIRLLQKGVTDSGSGHDDPVEWPLYEAMSFIDSYLVDRDTESNYGEGGERNRRTRRRKRSKSPMVPTHEAGNGASGDEDSCERSETTSAEDDGTSRPSSAEESSEAQVQESGGASSPMEEQENTVMPASKSAVSNSRNKTSKKQGQHEASKPAEPSRDSQDQQVMDNLLRESSPNELWGEYIAKVLDAEFTSLQSAEFRAEVDALLLTKMRQMASRNGEPMYHGQGSTATGGCYVPGSHLQGGTGVEYQHQYTDLQNMPVFHPVGDPSDGAGYYMS